MGFKTPDLSGVTVTADDVLLATPPGGPSFSVQHLLNHFIGSGMHEGGVVTDAGGNTVNVTAGAGIFKAVDDPLETIYHLEWPAALGVSVPSNTTRFIIVSYNAGSPIVSAVASLASVTDTTNFLLAICINEAGTIHVESAVTYTADVPTRILERFYQTEPIRRDESAGGLILSNTGTRNLAVTAGALWSQLTRHAIAAFDSSGASRFDRYYRDGSGGWTKEAARAQWPGDKWDNGSGTLQTVTNKFESPLWFYIETDGDVVMLYGQMQDDHTAVVEASGPPSSLPPRLQYSATLLGRIIFHYEGAVTTVVSVESAFTSVFNTTAATDHGSLAGLTDDDHPQYLRDDSITRGVKGLLYGLTLSNNAGDATNDIDIAAGVTVDNSDGTMMTLASALTKQSDVAWAVGTNQGGLDTGAVGNNTYHVWLIKRPDTGVVDALFSLSATAPTMPANYTKKRRIGSIIRAAGAIVLFAQIGDFFYRMASILDVNANNPGTGAVTRTLSVPAGIVVLPLLNASIVDTTPVGPTMHLSPLAVNDEAPSGTAAPLGETRQALSTGGTFVAGSYDTIYTNTSSQIRSRLSSSDAGVTLRLATLGWIDTRGKDA